MHKLTEEVCSALAEMGKFISFRRHGIQRNGSVTYAISDIQNWNELLAVYESLADEKSKKTFVKLVIFRQALGLLPRDIAIDEYGFFSNEEWKQLEEKAKLINKVDDDCILADRIDTWILKGYEYGECRAAEGDVVIDAGAFTGNTSIYFSQLAGNSGAVYAFEPSPEIYEKLCSNIKKYTNIIAVNQGLAQEKGILLFEKTNNGFGSGFRDGGKIELPVSSIDSFVEEKNLERVDFIKMDIEGYEGNALLGARSVIQKYKPKMAICIYHKPEDIFVLQKQIYEMCNEYKFYIKHNYKYRSETVLFCMPTEEKCALPVIESNDGSIVMQEVLNSFNTQIGILASQHVDACTRKKLTQVLMARHKVRLKASWNRRVAKFMRSCQKRRVEIAARYQAWRESKKK